MARNDRQVNFRIPDELLQRVAADATANNRSTTAEIVARLEASGKTLRDEFAMAALTGLLTSDLLTTMVGTARSAGVPSEGYIAASAYEIADAMLAARQKGGAS